MVDEGENHRYPEAEFDKVVTQMVPGTLRYTWNQKRTLRRLKKPRMTHEEAQRIVEAIKAIEVTNGTCRITRARILEGMRLQNDGMRNIEQQTHLGRIITLITYDGVLHMMCNTP